MMRPTHSAGALALALLAGLPRPAVADSTTYRNLDDFSSEAFYATGWSPVGARAAALGGAYTAISDDATGLEYNPAGLAQLVHIELALGFHSGRTRSTFHMFDTSAEKDAPASGLDVAAIAYPIPTYRGSLVLAGGLFRERSNAMGSSRFDRRLIPGPTPAEDLSITDDFTRKQTGTVWRAVGGLGVDVLHSLSLGLTGSFWTGTLDDTQHTHIIETNPSLPPDFGDLLHTEARLNAFSVDLGLLAYAGGGGRVGLVLHSPVWMTIAGDATLQHFDFLDTNNNTRTVAFIEQRPTLPWSANLGVSYSFASLLLSAETHYVAWDEIDVDSPPSDPLDPRRPNDDYTPRFDARGGAEWTLPRLPVRLRGGYSYEPLVYDLLLGNPATAVQDRETVTFGAGVLLANTFALDFGVSVGKFTRADRDDPEVSETRRERRFLLTSTYRY